MSKQTSMRFGPETQRKLAALAKRYGTATEAVAIAIDRMYKEEIMERDNVWWKCECGEYLPEAGGPGSRVQCEKCGRWYEFNHWALNRWPGDAGASGLEPRPVL